MIDYLSLRNKMVEEQVIKKGINNHDIINAMRKIPRHLFVSEPHTIRAYGDYSLPIQENQTILNLLWLQK